MSRSPHAVLRGARAAGLAVAALLALPGAAVAAETSAPAGAWQAEAGLTHETLDRGRPAWREADLTLRRRDAGGTLLELGARRTERWQLQDTELAATLGLRLDPAWTAQATLAASPTHRVLPRTALALRAQRAGAGGWVFGGGAKRAEYDADRTTAVEAGVERYFGSAGAGEWRAAATLIHTRLDAGASAAMLRWQLDRYFGPHGRIGLLLAHGREVERLDTGLLALPSRTALVQAHWPLGGAWTLLAQWGTTELEGQVRRTGGRVGVRLDR